MTFTKFEWLWGNDDLAENPVSTTRNRIRGPQKKVKSHQSYKSPNNNEESMDRDKQVRKSTERRAHGRATVPPAIRPSLNRNSEQDIQRNESVELYDFDANAERLDENEDQLSCVMENRSCHQCQLKKLVCLKTKQPIVITDTPYGSFDKIAMDSLSTAHHW